MQVVKERSSSDLAHCTTLFGSEALYLGLDGVEGADALQRLGGEGGGAIVPDKLEELSAAVRPAVGERDARSVPSQGLVNIIAVALEHALEGRQELSGMFGAAARRVDVDHDRRVF